MGLLDNITTAKGAPSANYLRHGRHLIKVKRLTFRELGEDPDRPTASFSIDGTLLKTTSSSHTEDIGSTVRANDPFKFPQPSLARMRRALAAMKSVVEGRVVRDSEITKEVADQCVGEEQPLTGSLLVVIATTKPKRDSEGEFTKYEYEVPSPEDVAGLI